MVSRGWGSSSSNPPISHTQVVPCCICEEYLVTVTLTLVQVTSTFGAIPKDDSTKKVCKKPLGAAADTANWDTSVEMSGEKL